MQIDRVRARGDRQQLAAAKLHDCALDGRAVNGDGRELGECGFESPGQLDGDAARRALGLLHGETKTSRCGPLGSDDARLLTAALKFQ